MDQEIADIALAYARRRRAEGRVPTMLGIPGVLALMYQNISNYEKRLEHDEILELASNALFVLEMSVEKVAPDLFNEEEEKDEEDTAEDKETEDTSTPPSGNIPPLPERFTGWQRNPSLAWSLMAWLIDEGYWENLTEEQREGIEEVASESTDED